jgi:hypothetical protein
MTSAALSLLVLAGSARASGAPAAGFMRPILPPPGALVLQDGMTATLKGQLAVRAVDGKKQVYVTNLDGQVYERHVLYYPAVVTPPGIMPHPRPPFGFVQIKEAGLDSSSRDLVALAKLVGTQAKVELTGTWGYFEGGATLGVRRGLTVTTATLRGQTVPEELPSLQRLIATAKKAVKDHILGQPDTRIHGEPTARHLGALLVRVDARVSSGWCGTAMPVSYVYDGLTGEVRPLVDVQPAAAE